MKLIVIQGHPCLGKTTLAEELEKRLPNSKVSSIDKYREMFWDSFGFASKFEKKKLDVFSRDSFTLDLKDALALRKYDYIIVEHDFNEDDLNLLKRIADDFKVPIQMIYISTDDCKGHEIEWKAKSVEHREHQGHCASSYISGMSSKHRLCYNEMISRHLPKFDECIELQASFQPFKLSLTIPEIIDLVV